MSLCNLIWKDMDIYVLRNKKLLIVPILSFIQCLYIETLIFNIDHTINGTLADYIFFVFRGADPMFQTKEIAIPVFWISNLVVGLFVTIGLLRESVQGFGVQMLIRSRSGFQWWISKCVTIVILTLFYFILLHTSLILYCALHHVELTLRPTARVIEVILDSDYYLCNEGVSANVPSFLLFPYIFPFMAEVSLNMLQLLFSLRFKPVLSFIITNCFILVSLYTDHPLAFTGYAMLKRSSLYVNPGMSIPAGICICVCVLYVSVVIGGRLFEKGDVL